MRFLDPSWGAGDRNPKVRSDGRCTVQSEAAALNPHRLAFNRSRAQGNSVGEVLKAVVPLPELGFTADLCLG